MYRAEEDYIKKIYELTFEKQKRLLKVSELSSFMRLTDQTVNEMVKKLASKNFLQFIPYKGIKLTRKGFLEAKRMIRAHRIWEVFLTEKLGYTWGDVHDEAERLEHATSPKLLKNLDAFMNYPKFCGHGNAIPQENGKVFETSNLNLFQLNALDEFRITRVVDCKELLSYLDKNKISINQNYTIRSKDDFGEIIEISGKLSFFLSKPIATLIFVEKINIESSISKV